MRAKPDGESVERRARVVYCRVQACVGKGPAGAVLGGEARRRPDALYLPPRFRPPGPRPAAAKMQNFRLDEPALRTTA